MNALKKTRRTAIQWLCLVTIASLYFSCGGKKPKEKDGTAEKEGTTEKTIPLADSARLMYAWANPVKGVKIVDHTWVTTTPSVDNCPPSPNFWYCWGVCHLTGPDNPSARSLGSSNGNIALATCITTPDNSASNVNTHGGITGFYGFRGVCHQVANRTLYATAVPPTTPPLVVSGAHGYWLSHFLYGTYGRNLNTEFAARITQCGGDPYYVNNSNDMQAAQQVLQTAVGPNKDNAAVFAVYRSAQNEMHQFMDGMEASVTSGTMSILEYCTAVNKKLTELSQKKLVPAMGEEAYTKMFGFSAREPITLLDLEIARQEDAKR